MRCAASFLFCRAARAFSPLIRDMSFYPFVVSVSFMSRLSALSYRL
jgi:hypothetical protein